MLTDRHGVRTLRHDTAISTNGLLHRSVIERLGGREPRHDGTPGAVVIE
jgi:hypothetical protein